MQEHFPSPQKRLVYVGYDSNNVQKHLLQKFHFQRSGKAEYNKKAKMITSSNIRVPTTLRVSRTLQKGRVVVSLSFPLARTEVVDFVHRLYFFW